MAEVYYEWDLQEVCMKSERRGAILSVPSGRLCEVVCHVERIRPDKGHKYRIELRKDVYSERCLEQLCRRYYAEVDDGLLSGHLVTEYGRKRRRVPERFHSELTKYRERLKKVSNVFWKN